MTPKKLSRRTLLRGLGTAVALPALDSMIPAFAAASKVEAATPGRMVSAAWRIASRQISSMRGAERGTGPMNTRRPIGAW